MKSYYLIDSKDLTEIADSIKNTITSQSFTINNSVLNQNTNEYEYKWYRIMYAGSNQPSPGYSFSVELEGALATDIIQIDSISSAFNYDIKVEAYRNYNNTKDIIGVTIYSGENEVSGECTITGTLYHTGTGTGTVTIPAGETSVGEVLSNKLEWPEGFINAIDYLPSHLPYTIEDFNAKLITNIEDNQISYLRPKALAYTEELTKVKFNNCLTIDSAAFLQCINLSQAIFPNCTLINYQAFYYCSSLSYIELPNCQNIGSYAFGYTALISADFPECITLGSRAFTRCQSLQTVNLSKCTIIYPFTFQNCYNLTTISLPACSYLGESAFTSCFNLISLYLMGSSVVTCSTMNTFSSTPINGYTGSTQSIPSIYVPSSLYNDYINTDVWQTLSNIIVGV